MHFSEKFVHLEEILTRTSLNSDIKMKTVNPTQRSLYPIRRSVCSFVGRPSEAKRRDEQSLRLFCRLPERL